MGKDRGRRLRVALRLGSGGKGCSATQDKPRAELGAVYGSRIVRVRMT